MSQPWQWTTRSPAETLDFGASLGEALRPGDVVALIGDLGAGKTWFTKGVARGLGVAPEEVTSPTFVLMRVYEGRLALHHFDAYRLGGEADFLDLGAEEVFFGDGASVVEWADRVPAALPEDRLDVRIEVAGETERDFALSHTGPRSEALLHLLRYLLRGHHT